MARVEEFLGAEGYIRLTRQLIRMLNKASFNSVLGIGRGGAVLGVILSHAFNKPFLHQQAHYIDVKRGLIKLGDTLETLPPVLVVDDLVDTGRTMLGVVERLSKQKILTAVLYSKPWSTYKPDFWVARTEAWIVFWYEDIKLKGGNNEVQDSGCVRARDLDGRGRES